MTPSPAVGNVSPGPASRLEPVTVDGGKVLSGGTISVADLLPAEVQAKVQASLAAKVFRQRTSDGRENFVAIDPDEVTATVVEYRPI